MAAKTRPYKVTDNVTGTVRLIEATTVAEAARYVVKNAYTIEPCAGLEGMRLIESGVKLESVAAKDDR
jgi:hypothetical protein